MTEETKEISETDSLKNRILKWLFAALTCLLICALYYQVFINTAYVEVELTVDRKTDFKVYWAGAEQLYAEKNMAGVIATPERKNYNVFLTNLGKVARLRIDTHSYEGEATLKKLVIHQEGWAPIVLETAEQFGKLVPLNEIAESRIDNDGLWVRSSGKDGNFELVITPERQGLNIGWVVGALGVDNRHCPLRAVLCSAAGYQLAVCPDAPFRGLDVDHHHGQHQQKSRPSR